MPLKTILLIDDDPLVAATLAISLETWGYRVATAYGHYDALALVEKLPAPPDLIIADYWLLQGKNGLQTIKAMFESDAAVVPVILITGDTRITGREIKDLNRTVLLHKPFGMDDLKAALDKMLECARFTPPH